MYVQKLNGKKIYETDAYDPNKVPSTASIMEHLGASLNGLTAIYPCDELTTTYSGDGFAVKTFRRTFVNNKRIQKAKPEKEYYYKSWQINVYRTEEDMIKWMDSQIDTYNTVAVRLN